MFEANQGVVLGMAGQSVDDILNNSDLEDPLDAMEQMIRWCHIAPTCPDTLGCFPYPDGTTDPFILDSPPKVFFAGNQKEFSYRKIQTTIRSGEILDTLLIALPAFQAHKKACLVNLMELDCEEILFDTEFDIPVPAPERISPIPNN